ncbi:hypothetical protein HanPSC8_Chr16g0743431 [Helianthus annuus]|nr:hypothetical protein HanPSC8_Chr16g0743431 [Helianthus annuus]
MLCTKNKTGNCHFLSLNSPSLSLTYFLLTNTYSHARAWSQRGPPPCDEANGVFPCDLAGLLLGHLKPSL